MIYSRQAKIIKNTQVVKECEENLLRILNETRKELRSELQPCLEAPKPAKKEETEAVEQPLISMSPATKLVLRETHHLRPNSSFATEFEFPPRDDLDFENPIVGFRTGKWPEGYFGWNVLMKNGARSSQP